MPAVVPIGETFGWLYIGMVVAATLWGISCIQTWWYFDNYPKDSFWLKCTVAFTFISDTVHQILITYIMYTYLITHFGDEVFIKSATTALYVEVIFNALTAFIVQSFLTWRIWNFKKNLLAVIPVYILVISALCTSIAYVAVAFAEKLDTLEKLTHLKPLSLSVNVTTAVSDIALSIAICVFLRNSKTGFSLSNSRINRLIIFSMKTGIITAACAVFSLIFILALPNTLVYFGGYFVIGRLYTNSLLATLNVRKTMRGTNSSENAYSLSDRARRPTGNNAGTMTGGVTVQIETIHQDGHLSSARSEERDTRSMDGDTIDRVADVKGDDFA